MDIAALKSRIRHYLRQNSEIWNRAIRTNSNEPPIKSLAVEIDRKIQIGVRRLEKYFNPNLSDKELTITLSDLEAFSRLQNMSLGDFISYLLDDQKEGCTMRSLTPWQMKVLDFFAGVHYSLRRELTCLIFSSKDFEKSTLLLEMLIKLYSMDDADIAAFDRIIDGIAKRRDKRKLDASSDSPLMVTDRI